MIKNRVLSLLVIFIFLLSFMTVPAFGAPPSPNHTITVDGSGFDGTDAVFDFKLIGGSEPYYGSISSDSPSVTFPSLDSGTYSIEKVSLTDGYVTAVEPQSIKLVGRDKSGTFTITLSGGIVEDTVPPTITLLGDNPMYLTVGDTYTDPGYTVTDNVDSSEDIIVDVTGEVNTSVAGSYTITYTATDTSGNSSTVERTVVVEEAVVEDTEPPVITLEGDDPMYLTVGDTYTEPGYTVTDNVDSSEEITVDVTGDVNTSIADTYTITYTATDTSGNSSTATRTVVVEEGATVETIHYVALGDSIATGTTGISGTMYTYAYQFRDYLAGIHGDNLTYNNLAVDGDDAEELLYRLNNDNTYIAEVEKADIITLSIGGNNIMDAARDDSFWSIDTTIAEAGTLSFETYYPQIISRIRSLNDTVKIISSTLYNPYNSANQPTGYSGDTDLHILGQQYISRINSAIRDNTDTNYEVADVHSTFYGYGEIGGMGEITFFYPRYSWWTWWYVKLTRDPHPNQAGQDIIRDLYIEAYESTLSYNTSILRVAV